jgi:hypothetical protein
MILVPERQYRACPERSSDLDVHTTGDPHVKPHQESTRAKIGALTYKPILQFG